MTLVHWLAAILTLLGLGYVTLVVAAWRRYGRVRRLARAAPDLLLDTFMPAYDVLERHHIRIAAPREIVFAAAAEMNMQQSPIIRAIFATRAFVLRANADATARPTGLLDQMRSLGWGELAMSPGREVVMGAVTQPWDPNPRFQAIPPGSFASFREPGFVKIAWTLRADSRRGGGSDFWTETRAVATDAKARRKFRWYWARFSPGVALIRYLSLAPL
ncbi:MAG TPA: hypothetical protein VFV98_20345, partial [Vicinamibacterales bacterium]|nr:hypothetical protein [Vicinamibacterales bacterium]